jgi:hypothetical protein
MNDILAQPESYKQQSREPNLWFARFERYRLAGPCRSLLGILNAERQQRGARPGKSLPEAWAKNAKRWQWRERAEAWDELERGRAREAHAQEVEEMNRRHVQEAKALQSKAIQRLKSLDLEHLSTADVLRYLIEAAKLERTALGQPESIAEQRLTGQSGGAVVFTVEDAVTASTELEQWQHDHLQTVGGPALSNGSLEVS